MALKHLVYLSKAKLDIYYPQIPPNFLEGTSAKVKVDLGVFSAELGGSTTAPSNDYQRMVKLLSFLEQQGLVGTETEAKPFLRATMRATALFDPPHIYFGGSIGDGDTRVTACLCASARHMIDYDEKLDASESTSSFPTGRIDARLFNQNSNNWQFGDRLIYLSQVTKYLADADRSLSKVFEPVDLLAPDERSVYERYHLLNPVIARIYPPTENLFDIHLSTVVLGPLCFALFGRNGLSRKRSAVNKLRQAERFVRGPDKLSLSVEEQNVLDAASRVSSNGKTQTYEFVARRLLQGISDREKVLLASPVYMALVDEMNW